MTFEEASFNSSKGFLKALQELKSLRPQLHSAAEYCEKSYLRTEEKQIQVQGSPQKQLDIKGKQIQVKPRPYPSEIPPPQTLSWHLATEDTSPLNRVTHKFAGMENRRAPRIPSPVIQIKGAEEHVSSRPIMTHPQSFNRSPTSSSVLRTFGFTQKESPEAPKRLSPFRSFGSPDQRAITRPLRRSRSMMSTFFFKRKSAK
ncbi:hypothetical protein AAC387_Pa10g0165 [Persea americana]